MKQIRIGCFTLWILSVYGCGNPTAEHPGDHNLPSDQPVSTQVETGTVGSAQAKTDTVVIKMMKFIPETIEMTKGDKIVFVNQDIVAHDVTEKDKAWNSPKIEPGETWTMIAEQSVNYFCSIHVVMTGKVLVNEKN